MSMSQEVCLEVVFPKACSVPQGHVFEVREEFGEGLYEVVTEDFLLGAIIHGFSDGTWRVCISSCKTPKSVEMIPRLAAPGVREAVP